jgi:hypothetical protein
LPRVAEAECATCHHIMPKTEMREVALSRVVGGSSSSGQSSRTSNRHSSGFNSRGQWRGGSSNSNGVGTTSRGTTRTRVERVWVCKRCKAPRSDGWFSSLMVKLLVAIVILFFVASYIGGANKEPSKRPASNDTAEPPKDVEIRSSQSVSPPPVIFGPRQEVAQPAAPPLKEYPPCSETVRDQCIDE